MDISKIALFSALENKMTYLSQRQATIAQNIANANTPNYKPLDVVKPTFSQLVNGGSSSLQMAQTHSGHMNFNAQNGGSGFKTGQSAISFDVTPTGNAVVLEEQMLKMQETAMDYQTTTALYKKMSLLVNTAIGDR